MGMVSVLEFVGKNVGLPVELKVTLGIFMLASWFFGLLWLLSFLLKGVNFIKMPYVLYSNLCLLTSIALVLLSLYELGMNAVLYVLPFIIFELTPLPAFFCIFQVIFYLKSRVKHTSS